MNSQPESVLEVGSGPRLVSSILEENGLSVTTVDIDLALRPTIVAQIDQLPFCDASFDTVTCFQVLEHMPFSETLKAFKELIRVSKRSVIISLPDSAQYFRYLIRLPRIGEVTFMFKRPFSRVIEDGKKGNHYWELNQVSYHVNYVKKHLESCGAKCVKAYSNFSFPYHHFFVFDKADKTFGGP